MIDVYGLDEAGGRWRQAATTLAAEVLALHASEVDAQGRFPSEAMAGLARGGFYGLCLDTQFGGHGQGLNLCRSGRGTGAPVRLHRDGLRHARERG